MTLTHKQSITEIGGNIFTRMLWVHGSTLAKAVDSMEKVVARVDCMLG